jgi:ferredoxin
VDTCPEVFEMGPDMAQVTVDEVPPEFEEAVQQAADECPVEAIIVE